MAWSSRKTASPVDVLADSARAPLQLGPAAHLSRSPAAPDKLPNDLTYTLALATSRQSHGLSHSARSALLRQLGRSRQAAHAGGMEPNSIISSSSNRSLLYTRDTIAAFAATGPDARHGAGGQRNHQRHALARRQIARQLGQLRRSAQSRNRGVNAGSRSRRPGRAS
jgi:hypothetical protein